MVSARYHKYFILLNIVMWCQILSNIVKCCVLKVFHAFFHGIFKNFSRLFQKILPGYLMSVSIGSIHLKHISMFFTYCKSFKVILMVLWISKHCFQICYFCFLLTVTYYLILIGTCYLLLPIWYWLSEACYHL